MLTLTQCLTYGVLPRNNLYTYFFSGIGVLTMPIAMSNAGLYGGVLGEKS